MTKKRYVNRILQFVLLICVSYGWGLSSFAAEKEEDARVSTTRSEATQLRVNNSRGFRNLQTESKLNLGPVVEREIEIDRDPTFRSNLHWLNHRMDARKRVLGGAFTKPGKYTDVVGIIPYIPNPGLPESLCTGILISKTTVLTAAHCVCDGVTRYVQFGSVISSNSKAIAVKKSTVLPGIDCAKYRALNDVQQINELKGKDLAVLELNEEVSSELGVPRRIADSTILSQWNNRVIRVVGFGLDEDKKYGSKIHADLALADCSAKYGCVPGLEIVVQGKDYSTDTCDGDSGGPAYIYDGTSDHYYLIAITSRGLPGKPCGYGGVYELINSPSAIKFLAQHTNILVGRGPR